MDFMTENIAASLYPYQIENIERQIIDYQSLNLAEKKTNLDMCPKCGAIHPRLIRGGKSHSGKQMYRCKECDKRFTYDNVHQEHSGARLAAHKFCAHQCQPIDGLPHEA